MSQALELASTGLAGMGFCSEPKHLHSLQDAKGTEASELAVNAENIDLVALYMLHHPNQIGAVVEVA